jgi:integrase
VSGTRRRGRGEDAIYRDGNRWRGAISLGYGSDGKRLRKKVSGDTKAEVVSKLRDLRRELESGVAVPDDRLTVGVFLNRWIRQNLPGHIADSTLDDYADTVRLHLVPAIGRKLLRKLTVADVDALWATKREQGYSSNSVRIMRAVLRRALGQAEREGLISRNVAALSSPPRVRTDAGRSLSVEQAKALLTVLNGHRLEALVVLMLAFGLRRGEALGLHWAALDWDAGTLGVTHGVKRVKVRIPDMATRTHLVIGELKTRHSRRTLYLTPQLLDALRRHRAVQAQERIAAGPSWQDHGLIFPSEVGTPLDPDNFSHTFARLCLRAGIGHWHPHELRHSGASLMLAQGTPLHVVSEVLGHASIAITKDVYGHLVEGDKRAAAKAMTDALLGGIGSQTGSQRPGIEARRGVTDREVKPVTWENAGALGGIRTPNLLIRSQMLCPLSYERRYSRSKGKSTGWVPTA